MNVQTASPSIDFEIAGMICASRAGRLERALRTVPGVGDASVNLATRRALPAATPAALTAAVGAASPPA